MPAPWESPEMLSAAERFLRHEQSEGRTYPQMMLTGVERREGGTVEHWQLPVSAEEFTQRIDAFMRREGWPDSAEEWEWNGQRENLEMAVMRLLRPR